MALIRERKPGRIDGGYTRLAEALFGIPKLGALFSQCHGTSISAGTELEKLIWERCQQILNIDDFVANQRSQEAPDNVFVASKKQVKKCQLFDSEYEPDFVAFRGLNCFVIEVKDGDAFDTKKSQAEQDAMTRFGHAVAGAVPFRFKTYMCCWNAPDKQIIHTGLKRRFALDQCLTGKDLCVLLGGLDYDALGCWKQLTELGQITSRRT